MYHQFMKLNFNNAYKYLIFFVFLFFLFQPSKTLAFGCTVFGRNATAAGVHNIPVDVILSKDSTDIKLVNFQDNSSCSGYLGWAGGVAANDALRTNRISTFSPALEDLGFSGYATIWGTRIDFPISVGRCVWPDGRCSFNGGTSLFTGPINVQIGMTRNLSVAQNGATVPAGTTIASFYLEQRGATGGASSWGFHPKTWNFILKNDLVIPTYTCSVENYDQTVIMPRTRAADIEAYGVGRYPNAMTPVSISLNCAEGTTVSVLFDGTTIDGNNSVLKNTRSGSDNIGIQLLFGDTPISFGSPMQIISNAQSQEILKFKTYYFYTGGGVSNGPVRAVSTFTFTYM